MCPTVLRSLIVLHCTTLSLNHAKIQDVAQADRSDMQVLNPFMRCLDAASSNLTGFAPASARNLSACARLPAIRCMFNLNASVNAPLSPDP